MSPRSLKVEFGKCRLNSTAPTTQNRMPPQLTPVSVSSLAADERICPICREEFGVGTSGETVKTQCNHIFDRNCIQQWFSVGNSTCPICRQDLRQVEEGGDYLDRIQMPDDLRDQIRAIDEAYERQSHELRERSNLRFRETLEEYRRNALLGHIRALELQQARAEEVGGDSDNDESGDDAGEWEEYEPNPPSSPVNYPSHRQPAPPRSRNREQRVVTLPDAIYRAEFNYRRALAELEDIDRRIALQRQRYTDSIDQHHQSERRILNTFTEFATAAQSNDRNAIDSALATQESVTPFLNHAYAVSQQEVLRLEGLMRDRSGLWDGFTRAREVFAVERQRFMDGVRERVRERERRR
ncbi:hypothetical protein SBOR_8599 [Sclerotinia borealis F-4128]|uniref:RING-type domain-containing protein n=1 Tax=Sclerotinia borealis (strain F-4128) TaxID=1432307 RepID=W9C5M1_SCLBF|nr:hypothetical protein SBOR_8599 [Sclerotinia borealis F-4128]